MRPRDELDPKRNEVEHLLRNAHLAKVRGQMDEARTYLEQAKALMPDSADVWAAVGDFWYQDGKIQEAHDAYKKAHELDPQNAFIERKYAQIVLEMARQQEQYRQWEQTLSGNRPTDDLFIQRNPGLAFLLSFLMPGVGQLYNGQFVKGGVILGAFVLGWIIFMLTPGGSDFVSNLLAFLVNPARVRGGLSGFQIFLALTLFLLWVYAFIDAPLNAVARNRQMNL
ncbi:MAG: tetratricopeptide repeat protein [Fimbriimonadales bacterium]